MKTILGVLIIAVLLSGCDSLSVFELVEREDGSLVKMNRITGDVVVVENRKEQKLLLQKSQNKTLKKKNISPKEEEYLYSCLMEIDGNYRLGNNKMLEGYNETQTRENERGDILQVIVSNKLYEAKGYFEKVLVKLNTLKAPNDKMFLAGDLLKKAAEKRIESIDLFTQGLYLKEQIGNISVANTVASLKGGSPIMLPQYNGEVERSIGEKTIADTFLVDSLVIIKEYLEQDVFDEGMLFDISSSIAFYSDVSKTDFDEYLRNGEYFLENEQYYDAIIGFAKALKVEPKNETANLGLIKSYIGCGAFELAEPMIDKLGELGFSTEEIDAVRRDYDNVRETEMKILESYKEGNVYLKIKANKESVGVNEEIIVETKLYVKNIGLKDIEYPNYIAEGFKDGEFDEPKRIQEELEGEEYDVLVFEHPLIALKSGVHTIGPATIVFKILVPEEVGGKDYKEYSTVIESDVIVVKVR